MKTRGLKNKNAQVTFEGKKHPTRGGLMKCSWGELKMLMERHFTSIGKIDSIAITVDGLDFITSPVEAVGKCPHGIDIGACMHCAAIEKQRGAQ